MSAAWFDHNGYTLAIQKSAYNNLCDSVCLRHNNHLVVHHVTVTSSMCQFAGITIWENWMWLLQKNANKLRKMDNYFLTEGKIPQVWPWWYNYVNTIMDVACATHRRKAKRKAKDILTQSYSRNNDCVKGFFLLRYMRAVLPEIPSLVNSTCVLSDHLW